MSLVFCAPRRRKETLGFPGGDGVHLGPPPPYADSSSHSPVDGALSGVRGPFLKLGPPWVPGGLPLSSWAPLGLNEGVTLARQPPLFLETLSCSLSHWCC